MTRRWSVAGFVTTPERGNDKLVAQRATTAFPRSAWEREKDIDFSVAPLLRVIRTAVSRVNVIQNVIMIDACLLVKTPRRVFFAFSGVATAKTGGVVL